MAGIKVPMYEVFKVHTSKLEYNKWDIELNEKRSIQNSEIVPLFQGQMFRSVYNLLSRYGIKYMDSKKCVAIVICDKKGHIDVVSKKGFKINGVKFKAFVGTTGGLKNESLLCVSELLYDDLYEISECGRNKDIPHIPAKLNAYRSLICSASQQIVNPNGILVVDDSFIEYYDDVIHLKDSNGIVQREILYNQKLENNTSDGFSLCTIDYMNRVAKSLNLDYVPSGVCLRSAWFKGMMFPFPIVEFAEKYSKTFMVKDVWGNEHDIRDIDLITTKSSLKLWNCYDSIEHYTQCCEKYGFNFSVVKICPDVLEDVRELNYQYLQSYDFDDDDIKELCEPTIDYLKDSMCGSYEKTLEFLGIEGHLNDNSWQQALKTNRYMLNDSYIIDSINRLIKNKVSEAKIGKLKVNGNYQVLSGDPFALMQSIFGIKPTGLLRKNEIYSKYWVDKGVRDLIVMRSPMTSHNNIRKCFNTWNDDMEYWYQYMKTVMIINGHDSFCRAENGADFDGDIEYSTDNQVLLRKYKHLMIIDCEQGSSEKIVVKNKHFIKVYKDGMGNDVGSITNKVTAMMEVQSKYSEHSKEYKELEYRIQCGQHYQQNSLDKMLVQVKYGELVNTRCVVYV